jgi:predicted AlkP superfamily phosphohydrolase/phosphomutase/tetratricopeptide (TPR) repeat protein
MTRKLLLIGWDAADWKTIDRLVDQGDMPILKGLIERGTRGNLTTLHPVLSPMLWTSIATGKRPFKHGIHGFAEPDPKGGARAISNLGRSTKAVWNILNQSGLRSNVIGWWPSHPVERINGVMVSDMYQKAPKVDQGPGQPWPLRPETVWPERLAQTLAEFRVRPEEMGADVLEPFIPKLQEIDLEKDKRPIGVAKILAETASIHACADWVMDREPWDFMAVYFDAIDHFGHGFMKYHHPRQDWIPERDFELYSNIIDMGYRFHDLMLGQTLSKIDLNQTTVVICSDHGFHPDHLRPRAIPKEPAGPAVEHREHGVFLIAGPGIRKDALIHGATLLDVTPTILTVFGLPVGEDMDGEPLLECFEPQGEQLPEVEWVESWDAIPGDDGRHPEAKEMPGGDDAETMQQLVDLGYIERPDVDKSEAQRQTQRELDFNLAESLMDAGRFAHAIDILERLWRDWPMEHRFGVRLAYCAQMLGQTGFQRQIVEALLERRKQEADAAREHLKAFHAVLKQRKAERGEDAADEAELEQAAADEAEAERLRQSLETPEEADAEKPPLMSVKERGQYLNLRAKAQFSPYFMHYLLGNVLFDEGRYDEALAVLAKAEQASPKSVRLLTLIGRVYLEMRRPDDAEQTFGKVIGFDPLNPDAHLGLTRVALARGQFQRAAQLGLKTVGLRYHFPWAHHYLGVALEGLARYRQAVQAFEVAVSQNPNLLDAHRRLEHLYSHVLGGSPAARAKAEERTRAIAEIGERIEQHRARRAGAVPKVDGAADVAPIELDDPNAPKPEDPVLAQNPCDIVVVSGLPRSGTSMMMQMLSAGGIAPLTDGERTADGDNPKGYFEYEPAKRLMTDRTWLPAADGKAVKIIAQLLPYLPPKPHQFKVIFMERDLDEVAASQDVMLANLDKQGARLPKDKLKQAYAGQIAGLKRLLGQHGSVATLWLNHAEVLAEPEKMARRVALFLGPVGGPLGNEPLDEHAMAAVVDPSLHRQRVAAACSRDGLAFAQDKVARGG